MTTQERETIRKELERLSPDLAKMQGKGDGFEVPHGYFNALSGKIIRNVRPKHASPSSEQVSGPETWLLQIRGLFLKPAYAIAFASLCVLCTAGWFLYRQGGAQAHDPLAEISSEDAFQYAMIHIDEFDISQLDAPEISLGFPNFDLQPRDSSEADQFYQILIEELEDVPIEDIL